MHGLASHKVKALIPLDVKNDIHFHPRLSLIDYLDVNIWVYYSIMSMTPIVMKTFSLFIPLIDRFLQADIYRVYSLPALHPEFKVQFTHELEGQYWGIPNPSTYAAILA